MLQEQIGQPDRMSDFVVVYTALWENGMGQKSNEKGADNFR